MSLRLDANIDSLRLLLTMDRGIKRFGYAVVNGINNSARRMQPELRGILDPTFEVRKQSFLERQIAIIKPFANVRELRPFAEISIGRPPRLLLSTFQAGGHREPFTPGAKRVAVPITGGPARPTLSSPVPKEFTFRALRLSRTRPTGEAPAAGGKQKRTKRAGGGIRYGALGTFMIPKIGVLQRTPTDDTRLVYKFVESPTLKPQLDWIETAQREAPAILKEELEKAAIAEIARAGGKGL